MYVHNSNIFCHCKLHYMIILIPLLGLHSLSMPCRIRTMRASSVKDSVMLKLHRGLTSKNVTPSLSAKAWAFSVVT